MNEFIKIIQDGIEESIKQGIESNSVILNEKYDFCRDFYLKVSPLVDSGFPGSCLHIPPMLLGKQLVLLELPKKYVFSVCETKVSQNVETLYNENQLLKKYLKLVGEGENQCLVIKGVSSKKNKEDFNKIKEILGYEIHG